MDKDQRFRQAVAALYAYCEDRNNPLNGPVMLRLLEEVFAAEGDLRRLSEDTWRA